jgi:hypothetical protein
MYPLLHREGSTLQWLCVMILWNLLNGLPSKQHGPPILRRLILVSHHHHYGYYHHRSHMSFTRQVMLS